MAFEIDYLDDFTRVVAPKMIKAGMDILEPELRRNLDEAIGSNLRYKSRSKGDLARSVRVSNPFINDAGRRFKANIYFDGVDKRSVRNGEKAAYKEYGTRKQLSSHFIKNAVRKTRAQVINAMQKTLDNELTNL